MRRSLVCLLLALSLLLSGCGLIKTYEDTNGPDDFSLPTLTETDLLHNNSHSAVGMVSSTLNNHAMIRANTFNGVLEIVRIRQDCTITLDCSVTKGNARLYLCTEDAIVHDFALNEAAQSVDVSTSDGTVYLRIAGEDCGFSVEADILD